MNDVTIRALEDSDGPALAELVAASPDTGLIGVSLSYIVDPVRAFRCVHPNNLDFVAVDAAGRIVGTCGLYFEKVRYEGDLVDAAYFHSLMVHPDFRRRGLASSMADFRVRVARERCGPDVFIYAHIQTANLGSEKVSAMWSTQIVQNVIRTRSVKPLKKAPKAPAGVIARPVEPDELGEYARHSNEFYAEYNCYHPQSADDMMSRSALSPANEPVLYQVAAFGTNGEMLAGVMVEEVFRSRLQHIVRIPRSLRVIGTITREIPRDGILRVANVLRPWFTPGHEAAAAYMLVWVRHHLSGHATMFIYAFSPQGPFEQFIKGRVVSSTSVALAGTPWSGTRLMA